MNQVGVRLTNLGPAVLHRALPFPVLLDVVNILAQLEINPVHLTIQNGLKSLI